MKKLEQWTLGTQTEHELLKRCLKIVQDIDPDAEVILYGSRARGDGDADSDYDLLIVVNRPLDPDLEEKIAFALYDLERETDTVLSVQVYERQQWESSLFRITPFYRNVEREGVQL